MDKSSLRWTAISQPPYVHSQPLIAFSKLSFDSLLTTFTKAVKRQFKQIITSLQTKINVIKMTGQIAYLSNNNVCMKKNYSILIGGEQSSQSVTYKVINIVSKFWSGHKQSREYRRSRENALAQILVINRVRVVGSGQHTSTQYFFEYPLLPRGVTNPKVASTCVNNFDLWNRVSCEQRQTKIEKKVFDEESTL